jgi:hypothetical protein
MTDPTEESQRAGIEHLLRIAEEQAAGAVPKQAAGAEPRLAAGAVPQQAAPPSTTVPIEKVLDPVPAPDDSPPAPAAAQGEGRHRLDGARRRLTIPWRRSKPAAES